MKQKKVEPPALTQLPVFEYKGKLVADSRDVAAMIERPHWQVLRSIRTMSKHLNDNTFVVVDYFIEASYIDEKGETRPCYYLTEMGCDMVAHKQDGERGTIFTARYVKAFHAMRVALLERQSTQWQQARTEGKAVRRLESRAIKQFVAYAAASGSRNAERYYVHFTALACSAVGVEMGGRNQLSVAQLLNLRMVEQIIDRAILEELAAGSEYHSAFQSVKAKVLQVAALAFAPVSAPHQPTPPAAPAAVQPRA